MQFNISKKIKKIKKKKSIFNYFNLFLFFSGDQHGVKPDPEYYMSDLKAMIDDR